VQLAVRAASESRTERNGNGKPVLKNQLQHINSFQIVALGLPSAPFPALLQDLATRESRCPAGQWTFRWRYRKLPQSPVGRLTPEPPILRPARKLCGL